MLWPRWSPARHCPHSGQRGGSTLRGRDLAAFWAPVHLTLILVLQICLGDSEQNLQRQASRLLPFVIFFLCVNSPMCLGPHFSSPAPKVEMLLGYFLKLPVTKHENKQPQGIFCPHFTYNTELPLTLYLLLILPAEAKPSRVLILGCNRISTFCSELGRMRSEKP